MSNRTIGSNNRLSKRILCRTGWRPGNCCARKSSAPLHRAIAPSCGPRSRHSSPRSPGSSPSFPGWRCQAKRNPTPKTGNSHKPHNKKPGIKTDSRIIPSQVICGLRSTAANSSRVSLETHGCPNLSFGYGGKSTGDCGVRMTGPVQIPDCLGGYLCASHIPTAITIAVRKLSKTNRCDLVLLHASSLPGGIMWALIVTQNLLYGCSISPRFGRDYGFR